MWCISNYFQTLDAEFVTSYLALHKTQSERKDRLTIHSHGFFDQNLTVQNIDLTPVARQAEVINQMHRKVQSLGRTAKNIAASIGEELIKVKASKPVGGFMKWVSDNCAFGRQTSQDYMAVAKAKYQHAGNFNRCTSIREVLALGKTRPAPKSKTRAATLNDLRKVDRLRALRDDPATTEGEKENAQTKLDEIENEIGKVHPVEDKKNARAGHHSTNAGYQHFTARSLAREISLSVACDGCDAAAAKTIENALVKAFKSEHSKLVELMKNIARAR